MSNPSFENIDNWLFEYMEGNLSPTQVAQLEKFMLNNPDFEPDMDAWQLAKADASPVEFPGTIGRKRKPVPFWLVSTLALTTVFVAGMFFGTFVNPADTKTLQAESAAQTQEYKIALLTSDINLNTIGQNEKLSSVFSSIEKSSRKSTTSILNSRRSENIVSLNVPVSNNSVVTESQKYKVNTVSERIYPSENNKSIDAPITLPDNSTRIESIEIAKSEKEVYSFEEIVPELENIVISQNKESNVNENEGALVKENVPENSVESKDLESNSNENEDKFSAESHDRTAQQMTRGDRISSNYNKSFSSKVKSSVRKIIRMTDNPIALTNSKDIYYHAPNMQTLNVNAATVGNLLKPRLQLTSRAQWTGHSNQQLLSELSYDTYVKSIRGGIGVQMSHGYYNLGSYNVGQLALTYSPKFTVNKNFSIEPAIRLKMGDKRLNAQNLVPGQVIEMERRNERIFYSATPENPIKDLWYKDVALALSSNTKWFSAGFQMDNIGRHFNNVYNSNESNERSGLHYTASLGTDFVSSSKIFSFSPYVMCQKVENLSEIWGGSIFRYKKMTIGSGISSAGDYAGSIGVKTNHFMLTYNADMTLSNLIGIRLFSQQLTIRILMNNGRYGHTMLK
ncbi:MAG: type IX secretion system membrane protein PorP/SprF [Crocinitomicaceae bacterium]|nr:type IX secretion system membrane protein PorP/SprF [Crocinitomicaceae bacterium]